jgi:uncharacterized protein YwgA
MLRRQRTILKLLSTLAGGISTTQLQKYIFLLREETFFRYDTTFYEFLPYKFGPYSFSAHREVEALASCGYIQEAASSLSISETGRMEAKGVDNDTTRAVLSIISKYSELPVRGLLKDVYARYPWYAINSELEDLIPADVPKSTLAVPAVYTIGYEDRSVDGFLDKLLKAGISRIIDVRANPVSRKYGFARKTLANLAVKVGLVYFHFPGLGISSEKRRNVRTTSQFQEIFGYYERQILPAKIDEVENVAQLMKVAPSVLVCMEKEPMDCHRSRLAKRVASVAGLEVVHL